MIITNVDDCYLEISRICAIFIEQYPVIEGMVNTKVNNDCYLILLRLVLFIRQDPVIEGMV